MKTQRRTADEQYQLIMECRSSGLSDYQWCTQHYFVICLIFSLIYFHLSIIWLGIANLIVTHLTIINNFM